MSSPVSLVISSEARNPRSLAFARDDNRKVLVLRQSLLGGRGKGVGKVTETLFDFLRIVMVKNFFILDKGSG